MAIHDVSMNSDTRTGASLSQHDANKNRMADGTIGITSKIDDSTGPYVYTRDGQILVSDGDLFRVVIGRLPDGTYGIAVSKPDEDVLDAFS